MADFNVYYDPITITNNPSSVTVYGLDDTQNTIVLSTPQPVKSETTATIKYPDPIKTELSIPLPIKTESKAELDIKPVAFDQCLTVRLAPLPPTCITQPYQTRFGFSLFGVELFGFTLEGENKTIVSEPHKSPHIAWGSEQTPPHRHELPHQPDDRSSTGGGLRIRMGG